MERHTTERLLDMISDGQIIRVTPEEYLRRVSERMRRAIAARMIPRRGTEEAT